MPPDERPPPETPADADLAALEALAAGELDADAAAVLRRRIHEEPALARAWTHVEAVETALGRARPHPVPPGLEAAVLARLAAAGRPRREGVLAPLVRLAAAVLLVLGAGLLGRVLPADLPGGDAEETWDVALAPAAAWVPSPRGLEGAVDGLAAVASARVPPAVLVAGGALLLGLGVIACLRTDRVRNRTAPSRPKELP